MSENDELPVKAWRYRYMPDAQWMMTDIEDPVRWRNPQAYSVEPLVLLSDAQRIRDERDRLHDQYQDLLSELSRVHHERDVLRAENERLHSYNILFAQQARTEYRQGFAAGRASLINYAVVHRAAEELGVSYNRLSAVVRAALAGEEK